MNYLKIYCNLIRKVENRIPPDGYTEGHHVFPKSIFGENKRIVILTAREHYITHALLEKALLKRYGEKHNKTIKMTRAFYCMNSANKDHYYNSHLYESLRIRALKFMEGNEYRKGKKLSPQHIAKIIESNTGRKHSEETKNKMRNSHIGKKMSDESRKKMSLAKKGISNPEAIQRMANINKGSKRIFTEEHKKNISESCKGRVPWNRGIPRSEETKQKLREIHRGRVVSEDTKKKMSESHKRKNNILKNNLNNLNEDNKQK